MEAVTSPDILTVVRLREGYVVKAVDGDYAASDVRGVLGTIETLLYLGEDREAQAEYATQAHVVPAAEVEIIPPPQQIDTAQALAALLSTLGISPTVILGGPATPSVPVITDEGDEKVTRVSGRGREQRVTFGTGPDYPPPPDTSPALVNRNHPVIQQELQVLNQLNRAFLAGSVNGTPFTRKEWQEGVERFTPHIPVPMAEAELGELIQSIREDFEGE